MSSRHKLLFVIVILLSISVSASLVRSYSLPSLSQHNSLSESMAVVTKATVVSSDKKFSEHPTPTDTPTIPLYIIYSTPNGFEPNQLTVKAGTANLMIRNRSGIGDLKYQLQNPGEEKDSILPTDEGGGNGNNGDGNEDDHNPPSSNIVLQATFTPGNVVLTEDRHKNFICKITVVQ